MRFVDHGTGGAPEVMTIKETARPRPGDGEAVIEVAFAGVNRADVLQRKGAYPAPPASSPILGLEVSGRVAEVGAGVKWPAVGDQVCALVPGGGYAEFCAVPARHCLPIPKRVSLAEGAAIPEAYLTVWANVFEGAALMPGERLLVHGGTSGVGLAAIQLAKEFGAHVFTTVGSAEKAEAAQRAGAELVIQYRTEDFVTAVGARTGGAGVDVVLDMIGGSYVQRNLRCLADRGRLVQIGFMESSSATLDLRAVLAKRLVITGSALRPRTIGEKAALADALRKNVWPALAAGRCKPWIYRIFPWDQAPAAHALMESSRHIGKIVLEVHPEIS
ncbi:MAG: NAD(P)H-quinone oxidoreductase [Opitutaceae bacterium]